MNKQNIIFTETETHLIGEWADRAPDDEDRYDDDAIIITKSVPKEQGRKKLMAELFNAFDAWVQETRYGD